MDLEEEEEGGVFPDAEGTGAEQAALEAAAAASASEAAAEPPPSPVLEAAPEAEAAPPAASEVEAAPEAEAAPPPLLPAARKSPPPRTPPAGSPPAFSKQVACRSREISGASARTRARVTQSALRRSLCDFAKCFMAIRFSRARVRARFPS